MFPLMDLVMVANELRQSVLQHLVGSFGYRYRMLSARERQSGLPRYAQQITCGIASGCPDTG